jgi:subtilisin family serine protease
MRRSGWFVVIGVALLIYMCGRGGGGGGERAFVHVKLAPAAGDGWRDALGGVTVADVDPLFVRPAAQHSALAAWQRIEVRGDRAAITRAVARLAARADVVTAFVAPDAVPAVIAPRIQADGDSCPVTTPPYHERQGYMDRAPAGIDVSAAWPLPGGRGQAIWFADIEGNWNVGHEDVHGDRVHHAGGRRIRDRHWEAHGTAVLGEVVARDNGLGMTGIAPEVPRVITAAVGDIAPAAAIDLAQAELRAGDVLLIELHAIGPRGRFLPMEYWDDVYEAIRTATDRGVVVVEAAGNGAEDLDHRAYDRKLDRQVRDSGAIMVGAGAPAHRGYTDRSRLDFSNYGSRVDVQGWGRKVATLDYGDLQGCDAHGRKYTAEFAGTSSASPVVSGAAILVQSVARTVVGCPLAPRDLRALLALTGSPQTDGPHGPRRQHIGPRPDLSRALERMLASPPRCD